MQGNGFGGFLCTLLGCTQHFPSGLVTNAPGQHGGVILVALCRVRGAALCCGLFFFPLSSRGPRAWMRRGRETASVSGPTCRRKRGRWVWNDVHGDDVSAVANRGGHLELVGVGYAGNVGDRNLMPGGGRGFCSGWGHPRPQ
jgi:hypothetical protein